MWQEVVVYPSGLELAFPVDQMATRRHWCFVENGKGMADGHEEWNRAAWHVRGGVDSGIDCYWTLLSGERVVEVEKDDAD